MNMPPRLPAVSRRTPTTIPAFRSFQRSRALLAFSMAAFSALGVHAADLTWNLAGAGDWDTTSLNWTDGVTTFAWNNANNDDATFGALAANATVTLGTDITVNNLTFDGNSGINVFAGATDRSVTVNGVITNSRTTTITAVITGSNGLTKAGSSTLVLNAVNTYTGATVVQGGTLQARTTGALSASSTVTIGNSLSNATLDVRADQTIAGIVKGGTGNSTITQTQTNGTTTLTINPDGAGASAADSTFSGTITDGDGTGSRPGRFLALTKAGGNTLTLTGDNNYGGATTVSGGTLKLGSSLTASNGVTVDGGTLSGNDSATDIALGTGAVSMSSGSITPGGVGIASSFTVAADQTFTTTGGTLNFDLGASNASDQIFGSGSGLFSLTDTTLALNLIAGFDYGATYELFSSFSGGSISDLTITGYDTANWTAVLGDGTTGALGMLSFTATAIPEPASMALLFGGAALAAGVLVRRKRSA